MTVETVTVALRVTPQEWQALMRYKMLNGHETMSAALRALIPLKTLTEDAGDE